MSKITHGIFTVLGRGLFFGLPVKFPRGGLLFGEFRLSTLALFKGALGSASANHGPILLGFVGICWDLSGLIRICLDLLLGLKDAAPSTQFLSRWGFQGHPHIHARVCPSPNRPGTALPPVAVEYRRSKWWRRPRERKVGRWGCWLSSGSGVRCGLPGWSLGDPPVVGMAYWFCGFRRSILFVFVSL